MTLFSKIVNGALAWSLLLGVTAFSFAQAPPEKTAEKQSNKTTERDKNTDKATIPFQIQLLETHIRFEATGDSRKEVHTIVKLNNAVGAQQFSRLGFDYNRAFQEVEIPLVRVTHANGGTSEVLSSAITDAPNPAVEKYPAYHDVRVKSVRVLGLQEGDTIEYRVVTTTARHPLAPDFWLEHTFDSSGQVLEEHYEIDLPARRAEAIHFDAATMASPSESLAEKDGRKVYRWLKTHSPAPATSSGADSSIKNSISFSSCNWEELAIRLSELMLPGSKPIAEAKTYEESTEEMRRQPPVSSEVRSKGVSLTQNLKTDLGRFKAIYDFVSSKISTVDLPLGATGFRSRSAQDVLNSGYASAQDKYVLFAALGAAVNLQANAVLAGYCDKTTPAIPTEFKQLLVVAHTEVQTYWLDPSLEVAPYGMISPASGKCALYLSRSFFAMNSTGHEWVDSPKNLPFAAFQKVGVNATVDEVGKLHAKVKYVLRGDNELLLRVAFHQTVKEKWKDVAGLLALSDGFRGVIASANASDPMATKEPFTVEYELTQDKFVDWSKKPVRIPALLPQIGLPDASGKNSAGNIELGTPLDVETQVTLRLPEGTTAQAPAGTSVQRDYATYSSKYGFTGNILTAQRHIHFLKREVSGDRTLDYSAFVQAVQNDQAQYFVLDRGAGVKSAGLK